MEKKQQPTNFHSKPSTNVARLIMIVERRDSKEKDTKLVENLTNKKLLYLQKTKLSFSKFLNTHQSNKPSAALQLIFEEAEFVYSILNRVQLLSKTLRCEKRKLSLTLETV